MKLIVALQQTVIHIRFAIFLSLFIITFIILTSQSFNYISAFGLLDLSYCHIRLVHLSLVHILAAMSPIHLDVTQFSY